MVGRGTLFAGRCGSTTPSWRGADLSGGATPPADRVRGLPHNPAGAALMMEKLRNYVRKGEILFCPQSGLKPGTLILTSPSTTAAKTLPGRTLSSDRRLIWGGRRANIQCPKQDYWHLDAPNIHDLAVWAAQIRGEFPRIDIVGARRHRCCVYKRALTLR